MCVLKENFGVLIFLLILNTDCYHLFILFFKVNCISLCGILASIYSGLQIRNPKFS